MDIEFSKANSTDKLYSIVVNGKNHYVFERPGRNVIHNGIFGPYLFSCYEITEDCYYLKILPSNAKCILVYNRDEATVAKEILYHLFSEKEISIYKGFHGYCLKNFFVPFCQADNLSIGSRILPNGLMGVMFPTKKLMDNIQTIKYKEGTCT